MDEEFPQLISLLTRLFNVIDQIEGEVLLHCTMGMFIHNNFLFCLNISICTSDLEVVDAPIFRESETIHIICQSDTFFSRHDAKCLRDLVLHLFYSSESLAGEHSLVLVRREDCVPSNV